MPRRYCRFLFCLIAVILTGSPSTLEAQRFTVSPHGNDGNPGTLTRPFRTLLRARDAVRGFRQSHPRYRGEVVVTLRGGTYRLEEPFVLQPMDGGRPESPTIYRARKGESPVLSGGFEVTGWKERGTPSGQHIWAARIPGDIPDRIPTIRQMWVKGERRVAARHPNEGYLQVASVPGVTPATAWNEGENLFTWKRGDFPGTSNLAAGSTPLAEAVVMTLWTESHLTVASVDHDSLLLRTKEKTIYRLAKGDQYYLLNFAEGFDAPGEFLFDATSRDILYQPYPGEEIDDFRPMIPILPRILVIQGDPQLKRFVDHLQFEGIAFAHTTWHFLDQREGADSSRRQAGFGQAAVGLPAAIEAEGLRHSSFVDCTVRDGGTYGIALGKGCIGNTINHCEITGLGGGGIKIGSTALPATGSEATSGNCIANCEIGHLGSLYHSAVGIWIGQSSSNRIIHNHIHDP